MITVYGFPLTRSTRVTWLLEELGVDYHFTLVDFNKAQHRSAEYLAINPAGKVPAMTDGDLLLTESAAMVSYLCDKYADRGLIPSVGTVERAHYEQWSYFALCELEQPLWTLSKHKFALPKEQRVPEVRKTASWEFQQALTLLSKGLGDKDYILGTFSGADILLGHTLFWGLAFHQPIEQDNLRAYIERLRHRDAYQRASAKEAAVLET